MTNQPVISIVMPTYNSIKYIDEAIQSIIAQTFTKWELLVCHEVSSSDGTLNYLKQLSDKRITIIPCSCPGGISKALNIGIQHAKGRYIARADDDDILDQTRLEKQFKFLETHKEIGLCGSAVEMFGDGAFDWKVVESSDVNFALLLFYQPVVHPTFMFRRDVVESTNTFYNEEYDATEDYEFLTRISLVTKIGNIPKPLLKYRRHSCAATNKRTTGYYLSKLAQENFLHSLGIEGLDPEVLSIYGEWRDSSIAEYEESIINLLNSFAVIIDVSARKNIFSPESLAFVLKKRWREHFEFYSRRSGLVDKLRAKYDVFFERLFSVKQRFETKESLDPKITVVVPTYNVDGKIVRCMLSLQKQTFTDFCVYFVNDGDNFYLSKCIELINDKRFSIIQNQTRLGIAESLNVGLLAAKTKYIARADADDYFDEKRLKSQYDFLEKHPSISFLSTWQYTVDENGDVIEIFKCPERHDDIKAALLFACTISHTSVMLRKDDFVDNNLLYDKTYEMEDYELWTRAIDVLQFHCLQEPLVYYCMHNSSLCSQHGVARLNTCQNNIVAKKLKKFGIEIDPSDYYLISGWVNLFSNDDPELYHKIYKEQELLLNILKINKDKKIFNQTSLRDAVLQRWEKVFEHVSNKELYYESPLFPRTIAKSSMLIIGKSMNAVSLKLKCAARRLIRPFYLKCKNKFVKINRELLDEYFRSTVADNGGHAKDIKQVFDTRIWKAETEINRAIDSQILSAEAEINVATDERISKAEAEIARAIDSQILSAEAEINQATDERISKAEAEIARTIDARIINAETEIKQTADLLILKAETDINQATEKQILDAKTEIAQTVDARVWKAETVINTAVDARVWKAETVINAAVDARMWKAEMAINTAVDAHAWKAETEIKQAVDTRIWKAETEIKKTIGEGQVKLKESLLRYVDNKIHSMQTSLLQQTNEINYLHLKHNLKSNEKVRIVFLFQIASFWPSWDTFFGACMKDPEIDVKVLLLDNYDGLDSTQMTTSRHFLENIGVDYKYVSDFDLISYSPHVFVLQTPYDNWHRPLSLSSGLLKSSGNRIVYITYGIEISDDEYSRKLHFNTEVTKNAWRIYTFSKQMIPEYIKHSSFLPSKVRSFGHPKFDRLIQPELIDMPPTLASFLTGEKILVWKIHFPVSHEINGKRVLLTPKLTEYVEFARKLLSSNYNLKTICLIHPKFFDGAEWENCTDDARVLIELLEKNKNVFIFADDDYRPALTCADFFIADRSAVMVEMVALKKQILFLHNPDFVEPLTPPIQRLVDTFYHGTSSKDMLIFVSMCLNGIDPKINERTNAFEACIGYLDGKAGERIKNDIVQSLKSESNI